MFKWDSSPKFKFSLGDRVRDTITGFKGIVILRSQWLNNCNTYGVQPTELKDGVPQDWQGFDELQLESVKKSVKKSGITPRQKTDGSNWPVEKINRT